MRVGQIAPACQRLSGQQTLQMAELGLERPGVVAQVRIVAQQERDARRVAGVDAYAARGAHAFDHRLGHVQPADLAAFGFGIHRARRVKAGQRGVQSCFEGLLTGLLDAGQGAEHRALVRRQPFEIEDLRTLRRQRVQHCRLGAAGGAADNAQIQRCRQGVEPVEHVAAKALVAALQLAGVPADHAQPGHERAAALPAAPAIHQRPPVFGLMLEMRVQMARHVRRHQRAADAPRLEGGDLLVDRAHAGALVVVEHRHVDRTGDVIVSEFGR